MSQIKCIDRPKIVGRKRVFGRDRTRIPYNPPTQVKRMSCKNVYFDYISIRD